MKSSAPLVSVIMNCYNGQRYLREAIDSVLAQTYRNWEVIFWDNQSTDQSAEIFQDYTDLRLKYFYAPTHTLLYEARNHAIEKSVGEFIAFLDVDDWWHSEKLEKQIPLFRDPEVGFVCSKYRVVQEKRRIQMPVSTRHIPHGWVLNELLMNYSVGLLTLVIRRVAFEALESGCDPRFHVIGDMDLVIRLAMKWKMACCQEKLAYYRLHGENEGQKQKARQVAEFQTWVGELGDNPSVTCLSGYKKVVDELAYMQGRLCVAQNQKVEAWRYLRYLPLGKYKVKLALLIMNACL